MSRRFSAQQRAALYLAQDGCCALCGVPLDPGWHSDHIHPWSRGGATDVTNGQAVCPACNLRKGARVVDAHQQMRVGGASIAARRWQREAFEQYRENASRDWLISVAPGGGKTWFGQMIARRAIAEGTVERVVIITPTRHIQRQWTELPQQPRPLLVRLGILDNTTGTLPDGFDGGVLTYASVQANPHIHRIVCQRKKTLVIFDEVHHAGTTRAWGEALAIAFEPATLRLGLTGTPWRDPKAGSIPTARYDDDGYLIPNYRYSYADAIRDKVCRPIEFKLFDGEVRRTRVPDATGCVPLFREAEVASLSSADEDDDSQILLDILRPEGEWMRSIIQQADADLLRIMRGAGTDGAIPDAKGLLIAHSRDEARALRKTMQRLLRAEVALIISDPDDSEPDPEDELKRFRRDARRWAVAVNMVSEGVDIPNLYVGIYATRKKTPLWFMQLAGRFVRVRPPAHLPWREGKDRAGIIYLPAVPTLTKLAQEVQAEIAQALRKEDAIEDDPASPRSRGERVVSDLPDALPWGVETSEARLHAWVYQGGMSEAAEYEAIQQTLDDHGIEADRDKMTDLLLKLGVFKGAGSPDAPVVVAPPRQTRDDRTIELLSPQEEREEARRLLDRAVRTFAAESTNIPGELGERIQQVNGWVMGRFGNTKRADMSTEQLRDACRLVEEKHRELREGG